MAEITLLQAQAEPDGWMAARAAVKAGQHYKIGGRERWRTDAAVVPAPIEHQSAKFITLIHQA